MQMVREREREIVQEKDLQEAQKTIQSQKQS